MNKTPPQESVWNREWKGYNNKPYFKPNLSVISHIRALFSSLKGKKILELGAGSGCDLVALAQDGAETYGLDFSSESIKTMRYWAKQKKVKIQTEKGDITHLSYPRHFFDCVYSVGLMEHFVNPMPLIRRQIELVKPGGFYIIDVPQTFTLYSIMKHIRMIRGIHPFGWETQYSIFDLQKIARRLGYPLYEIYGRDLDIANRAPKPISTLLGSFYHKYLEKSFVSPYISLCIGIVLQIT